MNVFDAITTRKSVRAYRADPIPRAVLEKVLEAARWSPSWCNSQPWEFFVLGGEARKNLAAKLYAAACRGEPIRSDFPYPTNFPDKHQDRRRLNGKQLFSALGIAREDRAARDAFNNSMFKFFDAPCGIVVTMDRGLSPSWGVLDIGCAVQSVLLEAHELGLGTCAEASIARYPDIVRKELGLEERLQVVCGIAIGYPAEGDIRATFRSPRCEAAEVVTWMGF